MPTKPNEVTVLLRAVGNGDAQAPPRLLEVVYDDLRLASAYMQGERPEHTLQATALVHEAYLRLVDWKNVDWESRAQFFAVAAQVMRRILVDHARARKTQKRAGGQKVALDQAVSFANNDDLDVLALEEALVALEKLDGRQAKIVELRFFGGLSIEETAHVLNTSPTTVKREWTSRFSAFSGRRKSTRDSRQESHLGVKRESQLISSSKCFVVQDENNKHRIH